MRVGSYANTLHERKTDKTRRIRLMIFDGRIDMSKYPSSITARHLCNIARNNHPLQIIKKPDRQADTIAKIIETQKAV